MKTRNKIDKPNLLVQNHKIVIDLGQVESIKVSDTYIVLTVKQMVGLRIARCLLN